MADAPFELPFEPYFSEADPPDADHPRAGWYVKLVEEGEETIFGPFTTEAHARHFAVYTQDQDHDH
jgi:acyl dehydratase